MQALNSALKLIAIIGVFALSSCEHKPTLNNYNWILGEWEVRQDHSEIFEVWKPVSDELYEGFNYTVKDNGDTTINEHLWLETREGKIIFSALVYGQNNDERVYFTLTKKNKKTARFENKNHDFPTVIEYNRSGANFMEVRVKNEDKALPPIKMHKIIPEK